MSVAPWLKLAGKALKANRGSLALPYKMTFVVTKECHSRCLHCKIWDAAPEGELSLEEIRAFAKNSPFLSWIDFTGGEPTDRKDLPEIVSAFLENCPDLIFVRLPTNGLNPDRIVESAKRILALRPPVFVASVSVDGPPELNDRLRGVKGDFERAVETFRRLKELKGIRLYAAMTLYPENASATRETIEAIRKHVPGFRARDLHVNLPQISAHYYGNENDRGLSADNTRELSQGLRQIIRQRGAPRSPMGFIERLYQREALKYLRTGRTPLSCEALGSSFYLSEKGQLYPCSIWNKPIGNIREHEYSLLPLWRTELARSLRKKVLKKECANCWTPCDAYPTLAANLLRTG